MQELQSIGAGGRFFGDGGGDRRLRLHHEDPQGLKCPRCDSLNTKFCYYNNYNLSQPRHFCKSCRRYWTKGGVLRNVPFGGGCRKSKRSKIDTAASESAATSKSTPARQQERKSTNSHSSSESSSLTAATSATEAVSAPSYNSATNNLSKANGSNLFIHQVTNPNLESGLLDQGTQGGIFSEIGSFTSLITSTNESLAFGFGNMGADTVSFRFSEVRNEGGENNEWQNMYKKEMGLCDDRSMKLPEITGSSLLDEMVDGELTALESKTSNGDFGSLDWHGSGDQGLFDLPNIADQCSWGQNQWTDQDHPSLYLP